MCFTFLLLNTAFVSAVCQGMRPTIMNCSEELEHLITLCWDSNPSSRPCLSSLIVYPFIFFCVTSLSVSQHSNKLCRSSNLFWNRCLLSRMAVGRVWLPEMGVVFVVSMPFTVSLFACEMIDHSGFTNLHSKCTSSTVILLPHLHLSVC